MRKNAYLCTRKKEKDAPVAQLVEHLTLNQGVQGSSPCGCTKSLFKLFFFAPVAQLVEHLTLNQGVQGSSPCGCTAREASHQGLLLFFFYINFLHHRHAALHSEACCYRGKYCRECLQNKFPRFVLHNH